MRTGELYIFGDSLSDDGARAVQIQQEPIDLYFSGRLSNGPVWHEYIRNDLAVAPAAVSISQAPNFEGYLSGSDLNGINFAHAGAVSSSVKDPVVPGAIQQAEGFAGLVTSGDIQAPDDQDVFVIWIGGNDFGELQDPSFEDILDIFQLNSSIVDNIETTVETLAAVGASNFLIMGLPTVGGAFLGDDLSSSSILETTLNGLVERYNDRLSDYVSSLNALEGQNALYVDIASFVDNLEDDPERYGFDNVTSDILTQGAPLDDQSYFSLDGIHPTGAGHEAIANFVVETAAAANFDLTAFAGNVIPGSARNDTLTGSQGPDTITGGPGHDQINGGPGFDTAIYFGNQSSYTLTLSSTSTTVTDRRFDGNGTDTLIDMEFLDFDTGDLNLTHFGGTAGLSQEDLENFIELYIALFNRAPDAKGLNFWGTAFSKGTTLEEMTTLFFDQDETRALYPDTFTNAEFVDTVYDNVLGRQYDQSGFDFWVPVLDDESNGIGRGTFIFSFLGGVQPNTPDAAYLQGKVDIGAYFAVHKGMSDVGNATDAMALFGDQAASDTNGAIAAIDAFYTDALDPINGEFLMPLVGVLDDPFAMV